MMMLLLILCVLITDVIEMAIHTVPARFPHIRGGLSMVSLVLYECAVIVLLGSYLNLFTVLIAAIYVYRAVNMARIINGRLQAQYAWHVTFQTSLWLILSQLIIFGWWWEWNRQVIPASAFILGALLLQLLFALLCALSIRGHILRMRIAAEIQLLPTAKLPSITVAIPARNETEELHDCIASLLASSYPKLEILVLDDCSQTRRTPEIIRAFAHDGVRFIQGREPRNNWLAKNQAYQSLAAAANGEFIIFAGVDIRFETNSLLRMVSYAVAKNKTMMCLMPMNIARSSVLPFIQPMRYVWELAFPRKLVNKPPVLSSCWLISAQALRKVGGFEAAAQMIVPEAFLARTQMRSNQYSFLASGKVFGIRSLKDIAAQRETAIRVGYPSTHRRPEVVAFVTIAYIFWITVPLIAVFRALFAGTIDAGAVAAVVVLALQMILYRQVIRMAYAKVPIATSISFSWAALIYVGLLNFSMYKYEFSEVIWKGRNVCLPVMQIVPRLPEIK